MPAARLVPQTVEQLQALKARALQRNVNRLGQATKTPTFPIYPDEPPDAVETQVAFFGDTPKYFKAGAWHPFTGAFRAAYGQLYNDAAVLDPGSADWTAEWNDEDGSSASSNIYTIRFTDPFATPPALLLTANNNNPVTTAGLYAASVKSRDPAGTWITVYTYAFDGTASDGGFDFLALAPA